LVEPVRFDWPPQSGAEVRKRKPGGGRPRFFTKKEIQLLQAEYRKLLNENQKIDEDTALISLRLARVCLKLAEAL
jgi:hypothetical protein